MRSSLYADFFGALVEVTLQEYLEGNRSYGVFNANG